MPTQDVTKKLYVLGYIVCTLKLLTSGMIFGSITLGTFTGSDFAMAISAIGAVYIGRRHSEGLLASKLPKDTKDEQN